MASPEQAAESARIPDGSGPGQLLRRARESRGIALHDIAAQLHLDARTIAALERDAFDELPAPTFVRGYLRGYARLLDVPPGPVMEAYNQEGFHHPDLVADIAEKPQAASGDLPVRMLTYLIVVVLAALTIWWWYDREQSDDLSPRAVIEPPATATGDAALALPAPSQAGDQDSAPAAASAPPPGVDGDQPSTSSAAAAPPISPAAGESSTQSTNTSDVEQRVEQALARVERTLAESERVITSEDASSEGAGASLASEGGAGPASATAIAADASRETPPASSAPATPPTSAPTPPKDASIRLDFPIEAWVEVYDRDGKRLFFNLVKPGRTLELSGPAPIRMVLGRTRGVSLRFNGEEVDLKPHIRKGGVAQLTIGE